MENKKVGKRGLFRRHRSAGGTLDRFEVALTSVGVAALRRSQTSFKPIAPLAPARMLCDGIGFFPLDLNQE